MDSETGTAHRCPVIDFDPDSSQHAAEWPAEFGRMRAECPRAWSDHHGGFWIASRYDDVVRIAQTPDSFKSGKSVNPVSGEIEGGISIPPVGGPAVIPDEIDNPDWQLYRNFVNRWFSPKAAEEHREFARQLARELIDQVVEVGKFDIVEDLGSPLPAIFTMNLFGLPLEDWRSFSEPVRALGSTHRNDPAFPAVTANITLLCDRLLACAAERRAAPMADFLSHIANGEIEGRRLTDQEVRQLALNIILGGVDTTTGLIANTLRYLSQNPEQRGMLIEDPSLIPRAREEFVRYFSPVHGLARNASNDVDMDGWKIKKGERVLLAYASANRDERIFEQAEQLQLDRFPNRHIGFGAGQHRCLGSFFARVMFESMLEEVLERIPDYRVLDEEARPYPSIASVNGWLTMPAVFEPGTKRSRVSVLF